MNLLIALPVSIGLLAVVVPSLLPPPMPFAGCALNASIACDQMSMRPLLDLVLEKIPGPIVDADGVAPAGSPAARLLAVGATAARGATPA